MTSIGLIGFERSGKTTLFNALTGAGRATGFTTHGEPHEGVVPAADARLDKLADLYQPKKTTPAVLDVVDFPGAGFAGALGGGNEPPSSKLLDQLSQLDALVHVVRAFDNDAVPHPAERIDAAGDIEAMQLELTFADLALIEKRLQRIADETQSMKAAERVAADRETDLLRRLQNQLGDGGFYLSPRVFDCIFDAAGWEPEKSQVREAFRRATLDDVADAVTDRMLEVSCLYGTAQEVRDQLERYEGLLDQVVLFSPRQAVPHERHIANYRRLIETFARPN